MPIGGTISSYRPLHCCVHCSTSMRRWSLELLLCITCFWYEKNRVATFSLQAALERRRPSFKVSNIKKHGLEIRLRPSPLIGGPPWLPLHVKFILRDEQKRDYVWDFVPKNATEKEVLTKLTALQSVPGVIRSEVAPTLASSKPSLPITQDLVRSAQIYCNSYPQELNLVSNNCWTFAIRLAIHLSEYYERHLSAEDMDDFCGSG